MGKGFESMLRYLIMLISISWAFIGFLEKNTVAQGANSCVDCHQRVEADRPLPPWYLDQFLHWYGSIHGRKGVTCEQCHGGDPALAEKKLAHQGVKSSKDPKSPIYYKRLPETCGSCHKGVAQQFIQSRHYKNLKDDRLAPTCTTCHGFEMDIGAVKPPQLMGRCNICHNPQRGVKPEVADLARQILEEIIQTERVIERAQMAAALAREEGIVPEEAEGMLTTARDRLKKSEELWHSFRLDAFRQELAEIQSLAGKAYISAKQKILKK